MFYLAQIQFNEAMTQQDYFHLLSVFDTTEKFLSYAVIVDFLKIYITSIYMAVRTEAQLSIIAFGQNIHYMVQWEVFHILDVKNHHQQKTKTKNHQSYLICGSLDSFKSSKYISKKLLL